MSNEAKTLRIFASGGASCGRLCPLGGGGGFWLALLAETAWVLSSTTIHDVLYHEHVRSMLQNPSDRPSSTRELFVRRGYYCCVQYLFRSGEGWCVACVTKVFKQQHRCSLDPEGSAGKLLEGGTQIALCRRAAVGQSLLSRPVASSKAQINQCAGDDTPAEVPPPELRVLRACSTSRSPQTPHPSSPQAPRPTPTRN